MEKRKNKRLFICKQFKETGQMLLDMGEILEEFVEERPTPVIGGTLALKDRYLLCHINTLVGSKLTESGTAQPIGAILFTPDELLPVCGWKKVELLKRLEVLVMLGVLDKVEQPDRQSTAYKLPDVTSLTVSADPEKPPKNPK
jgi:hypothetical protein